MILTTKEQFDIRYEDGEMVGNDWVDTIYYLFAENKKLQNIKCVNCLHYGLGQCLLYRECELSDGECGKGFIEIDNPNEHYCADFEDRAK